MGYFQQDSLLNLIARVFLIARKPCRGGLAAGQCALFDADQPGNAPPLKVSIERSHSRAGANPAGAEAWSYEDCERPLTPLSVSEGRSSNALK
jgi:hypothetical protein